MTNVQQTTYLPFQSSAIPAGHKDLIHDVAYDHHGHRLATASSDQTVKIWDFDPSGNTWICTATWKSHFGSVWKVTWAHPEFGQVIATCSFDRTAAIWEEIPGSDQTQGKFIKSFTLSSLRRVMCL